MSARLESVTTAPYSAARGSAAGEMLRLAGRLLMALLFVVFGYMKVTAFGGTAAYFARWGFPLPELVALIAIAAELGGGLLLLVGWKTRWVAAILAVYVAVAAAVAHRYWTYEPAQVFAQTSFFYKNLAIVGGLLCLAATGAGRYSVDRQ